MNNLENLNVKALSAEEAREVTGGFIWALIAGFILGYTLIKMVNK